MVIVFDPIDRESSWEFVPQPEHTHAATVSIGEFEAEYFCTLDLNNSEITNVILIAMDDDMSMEVYGDVDCPVLGRECRPYGGDEDLDRTAFEFHPYQDRNGNEYLEFRADFHLNHQLPEGLVIWASRRIGENRVDTGAQERDELDRLLGRDIRQLVRDRRILERRRENDNRHRRNLQRRSRDLESSDESYLVSDSSSSSSEQSSSEESSSDDEEMADEESGLLCVVFDEEDEGGYGSVNYLVGSHWWEERQPGDNRY